MKECTVHAQQIETVTAGEAINSRSAGGRYPASIGLDVHKDTSAYAVARAGRGEAESRGEIGNTPKSSARLVERLSTECGGEVLLLCYEAGPCGYSISRQLIALGQDCQVIAPSLIPQKPGDRIKTDRRDARTLAQVLRGGDLTVVWVSDEEQEAMRDLTRARDDMKSQERTARQQLNACALASSVPSSPMRRRCCITTEANEDRYTRT